MEESSRNINRMKNNDEIYLNDVVMEEEKMEEEYEIQPSLQIEENTDVDEGGKNEGKFQKKSSKKNKRIWQNFHYVGHFIV
jgi:hypothetical protein